jgi:biopolymer transport protein ExbB/TolQ
MNSQQGVYMDTDAVRGMAKSFGTIGDVLQGVNKAMEMLSNTLKATAFGGLVGGLAVAHYIVAIRPQIEDIAEKCEELDKDLAASANAYERGDELGSTRFH